MKKVRGSMPAISSILDYWNSDESKVNTEWEPWTAGGMDEESIGCCMICVKHISWTMRKVFPHKPRGKYKYWTNDKDLERSHLHSVDMGGSNDPSNLIIACRNCNLCMPSCCNKFRMLEFLDSSIFFDIKRSLYMNIGFNFKSEFELGHRLELAKIQHSEFTKNEWKMYGLTQTQDAKHERLKPR